MATPTQEIARETWQAYFDELSKHLPASDATLEIIGEDIGDQIAAENVVVTGITYDHKDDVFVVGLNSPGGDPEEYEHLIYNPKRTLVTGVVGAEAVFEIEDGEGTKHLIRVDPVPALPGD